MPGNISKVSASMNGFFVGLFGGVASFLIALILGVLLSSISSPLVAVFDFKIYGFLVSGLIISLVFGFFYQWRLGFDPNDTERAHKLIYYWASFLAGIILFMFLFNAWRSGANYL